MQGGHFLYRTRGWAFAANDEFQPQRAGTENPLFGQGQSPKCWRDSAPLTVLGSNLVIRPQWGRFSFWESIIALEPDPPLTL